jgi:hypothetical protein
MQSAEDWDGSNVADPLNNALQGCVLLQRQMRARRLRSLSAPEADIRPPLLTVKGRVDPPVLAWQLLNFYRSEVATVMVALRPGVPQIPFGRTPANGLAKFLREFC